MKECLSVLALCFSRDGLERLKEIGSSFLPVTLERGYLQGYTGQINLVPGGGGGGGRGLVWSLGYIHCTRARIHDTRYVQPQRIWVLRGFGQKKGNKFLTILA